MSWIKGFWQTVVPAGRKMSSRISQIGGFLPICISHILQTVFLSYSDLYFSYNKISLTQ